MPETRLISVADREADFYELFAKQQRPAETLGANGARVDIRKHSAYPAA